MMRVPGWPTSASRADPSKKEPRLLSESNFCVAAPLRVRSGPSRLGRRFCGFRLNTEPSFRLACAILCIGALSEAVLLAEGGHGGRAFSFGTLPSLPARARGQRSAASRGPPRGSRWEGSWCQDPGLGPSGAIWKSSDRQEVLKEHQLEMQMEVRVLLRGVPFLASIKMIGILASPPA